MAKAKEENQHWAAFNEWNEIAYLNYITNGWKDIPNSTQNASGNKGSTVAKNTQSNTTTTQSNNVSTSNKTVANRTLPAWVDPIAYRQSYDARNVEWYDPEADLNPEYLANMDMNTPISWGNQSFNQYGDDSSPEMQWTLWGMNKKYTWENTKNSDVNYNPDIQTWDLNPYYVYGQKSKVYGTLHPWYISQRNDNIASALYNEWKWSKEEVADFLAKQEWWFDSSEADRLNTIEAVWKRIGQFAKQNPQETPEMNLDNDRSGKIYGKSTAETWEPTEWINTLSDANSVFTAMNESRVANYNALNAMESKDIAVSIDSGTIPYGTQAFRDLQENNPAKYAEVMAEVKRLRGQDTVNAIASGGEIKTSADTTDVNVQATSDAVNSSSLSVSATQLLKSIDSILESNDTAKSAEDLMWSIEKDMATLKNRLQNLKKEATSVFKWDVPDYIVRAYMNNKSQEIQNQLSILEDRYNAAYNRYKTELSHAEWEAEMQLKKDSQALEEYKVKNSSSTTTTKWTWKATMRTERNNNPTAMTTDVAKMLWGELWVDYEIWDSFLTSDWKTLYTAKLIGDPIETTIRLIDRWILNGIDPFYRANWQPRWSYLSKIWITKDKWMNMDDNEKWEVIKQMLKYEWWEMENMLYYIDNWKWTEETKTDREWTDYDYENFEKFLDPTTNQTTVKAIAAKYWYADDIAWMTNLANEALKGKKKNTDTDEINTEDTVEWDDTKSKWYNPKDAPYYRKLLDNDYTAVSRPKETATMLWYKDANEFMEAARAWQEAEEGWETEDWTKIPTIWVSRYWKAYNMSKYKEWDSLSTAEQQIVKWILNYQEDPTTLAKWWEVNGTKNYNIRAAALAIWWDDYDVTNYQEAYKVVQLWNKANQAWWELSRNATAMDSLKDLYDIYHGSFLDRWRNNLARWAINWAADALWYEKTAEFDAVRDIAASEVAWALKGNASPTDPEIEAAKKKLSYNTSPNQFDKVIKGYATWLAKKMASEAISYEKVTWKKPYNMYNEYDWLLEWFTDLTDMNIANYFSDAGSYEEWESYINNRKTSQSSWRTNTSKNNAPIKNTQTNSWSMESSSNW